jgi:hypothetical protein
MLKRYAVSSIKVKVDGKSLQGYRREHLWDAWSRYLSPLPVPVEPVEPAVPPGTNRAFLVPEVPEVPQVLGSEGALNGDGGHLAHSNGAKPLAGGEVF